MPRTSRSRPAKDQPQPQAAQRAPGSSEAPVGRKHKTGTPHPPAVSFAREEAHRSPARAASAVVQTAVRADAGRASKSAVHGNGAQRAGGGRAGKDKSGEGKQEFGMPAIFDNVRDGLILVRYPEEVVVLFNRAASETCGVATDEVLDGPLSSIIPDAEVARIAKICSQQAVGEWPGHYQDLIPSQIEGPDDVACDVELHFCRVDDPETGAPLVLIVMRPDEEAELQTLADLAKTARRNASDLEARLRTRREAASHSSAKFNRPARPTAPPTASGRRPSTPGKRAPGKKAMRPTGDSA